ncbi:MAG: DUF4274 domain-containing protein [Oscillospiraceae bacterium]|nr:DUF4274 domain-containing protein [Oscillospiraceae bacterium]
MNDFNNGLAAALEINPELDSLLADYGYEIDDTTDSKTLDKYLNDYNWDDGFAIPYLITSHANCELATAVNAFWLAEGFVYFSEGFWSTSNVKFKKSHTQWEKFVVFITENIISGAYKKGELPYPKRWAEELRLDIQNKQKGNPQDKIEPILYGLGKAWE